MDKKTEFRVLDARETFLESTGVDLVTFGLLALCIWLSAGNWVWSIVMLCMFLMFALPRLMKTVKEDNHTFHSVEELQNWVDTLKE